MKFVKRAGEAGIPFLVVGGYAVIAHGYVVHSVGRDGHDDGGRE